MSHEKIEIENIPMGENNRSEEELPLDGGKNESDEDPGLYEASLEKHNREQFAAFSKKKEIGVSGNQLDAHYSDQTLDEVNEDIIDSIEIEKHIPQKTVMPSWKDKITITRARGAGEKVVGSGWIPESEYNKLSGKEKKEISQKRELSKKLESIKQKTESIIEKHRVPKETYEENRDEINKQKQEEINNLFIKKGKK